MQEKYKCPWCGCEEMVYGMQTGRARVQPTKPAAFDMGEKLIHVICKQCGTVVRSYVENTEKYVD